MSDYRISLNVIPNDWKICRFKFCYNSKKEIVGDKFPLYDRLALTLNGVIKRSKNDDKGLQPKDFKTYQILRKNDMVFKMIDLQNMSTSRVGRTLKIIRRSRLLIFVWQKRMSQEIRVFMFRMHRRKLAK